MDQEDDLKAFERRMIEIVSSIQPTIWRWRLLLSILIFTTLLTFVSLISDLTYSTFAEPSTATPITDDSTSSTTYLSWWLSSLFHKGISFSISVGLLLVAFLFGIHRKVVASSVLITRVRSILADYNMSCDTNGRLILRPRPPVFINRAL